MARIRSLKPGFCTSEAIVSLTVPCRLHFAMLWTYADDWGRGVDNARLIKAALWPLDDAIGTQQIEQWQDELHVKGRIVRYVEDGKRYFEVVNFQEHQRPNRRIASLLPDPACCEMVVSTAQALFEHNNSRNGSELPSAVVVDGEEQANALPALAGGDNPVSAIKDYIKGAKSGSAAS